MLLLIDNFDSLTYNLADYFRQCGATVEVRRNDSVELDEIAKNYQAIVISPGPGIPENAGCTMEVIQKYADKLPILGVCLGMQAIGIHYGAKLIKAEYPMHGKVSELVYDANHPLFFGVTQPLNVCRYHSLVLSKLEATPLSVIAKSDKSEPMALAHRRHLVWGVQFHPEAILTTQGLQLLKNWLSSVTLHNNKH